MKRLLAETPSQVRMSSTGQDLLDLGWVVGPGGVLLLSGMWSGRRREGYSPDDVGDYEYEVNDVKLPITQEASVEQTLVRAAHEGMEFALASLEAAQGLPGAELLIASFSVVTTVDEDFGMQGVTVRFSTERGDYPDWLAWTSDLERYQRDAVALVRLGLNRDGEP